VNPKIWSPLAAKVHDALEEEADLLEELLASGDGSHTAEQRAGWRAQLAQVRQDITDLEENL
jgi:hypothetical protein